MPTLSQPSELPFILLFILFAVAWTLASKAVSAAWSRWRAHREQ